jgi:hypothetical protein
VEAIGMRERSRLLEAARGASAGIAATALMTAGLAGARRARWLEELPPRRVTRVALGRAGARLSAREVDLASAAGHLGFGAAAGALLGALVPRQRTRAAALAEGVAFGLALWALSYAGWVPAVGATPFPARDRRERQATIAAAHALYGAALGLARGCAR